MMKEYWTYSTEMEQVEEVAILFNTLKEAEEHSLNSYLNQGCNKEDWKDLTQYYIFKVYE